MSKLSGFIFILFVAACLAASVKPPIECTRPFEEYACGSACQTTCENIGKPCPIVNIRCNDLCYCISGYARNSEGTCIPIDQCP